MSEHDTSGPKQVEARQYLFALPNEPGPSGRQDLEEFAAWFDITLVNSTRAFLRQLPRMEAPYVAFIACLTGVDILSGYAYGTGQLNTLFRRFVREYFPPAYTAHADVLYECRKTVIHELSPGPRMILVHKSGDIHLTMFEGRLILCADEFVADLARAADAYFERARNDSDLLATFRSRASTRAGGNMTQLFRLPIHPELPPLTVKRLP